MDFKKGDKVSILDEDLEGVIKNISGNDVTITTADGFEMVFSASELIKTRSAKNLKDDVFNNVSVDDVISEKEQFKKKKPTKIKPKLRTEPTMEVDLHIHQLIDSTKGMTNHDMLTLQVETAQKQLEFAMRKKIQRVVFIHGVGEGVLKMELETLFRRYNNVKFYDANIQKYGLGATEVYIYQSR